MTTMTAAASASTPVTHPTETTKTGSLTRTFVTGSATLTSVQRASTSTPSCASVPALTTNAQPAMSGLLIAALASALTSPPRALN